MSVSRRTWAVWAVGVSAYIVAVMHRTTFGVAGLEAVDRFGLSASALAIFAVLQLVVYASLQIPVGMVLDRVGPRRLIVAGALVMAVSQVISALATSVPVAVAGRVLLGAGDALTFVSVLRLIVAWFPPSRVPLVTQVSSMIGQSGQILSAVPFVLMLNLAGWTPAFLSAAAIGVVIAVLGVAVLGDSPEARTLGDRSRRNIGRDLVTAWRHPGTRLGLWSHFATAFAGTVFALLWGFPFLVSGQGLSETTAGWLLTLMVVAGACAAPFIGVMVQRHPLRRSWLVLGVVGVNAAAWTAVLVWPGRSPFWLLVVLVLALALGGPGSMVGLDYARTFNSPNHLGTASGIVNVGGFVASLFAILGIGLVIDARSGGSARYDLDDFRVAMIVQYVMWTIGLIGILRTRRLVRRRMAEHGVVVPSIRAAVARRRSR